MPPNVIKTHRQTSSLGQRAALLAVQELHFQSHIERNVSPKLRSDLRNVYRRLDRRGVYMAPAEPSRGYEVSRPSASGKM